MSKCLLLLVSECFCILIILFGVLCRPFVAAAISTSTEFGTS